MHQRDKQRNSLAAEEERKRPAGRRTSKSPARCRNTGYGFTSEKRKKERKSSIKI